MQYILQSIKFKHVQVKEYLGKYKKKREVEVK